MEQQTWSSAQISCMIALLKLREGDNVHIWLDPRSNTQHYVAYSGGSEMEYETYMELRKAMGLSLRWPESREL